MTLILGPTLNSCANSAASRAKSEQAESDSSDHQLVSRIERFQSVLRLQFIGIFNIVGSYLESHRSRYLDRADVNLELEKISIYQNIVYGDVSVGAFPNDPTMKIPDLRQRSNSAIKEELTRREVDILKPKSIDENTKIIVNLHGFMTDNVSQAYYFGYQKSIRFSDPEERELSLAEALNAVIVMPKGLKDRPSAVGAHFWSTGTGEACCNFWQTQGGEAHFSEEAAAAQLGIEPLSLDYDISFIEAAVAKVKNDLSQRLATSEGVTFSGDTFVVGHSNGAFLAHQLACKSNLDIKGLIALAGVVPNNVEVCKEKRFPVLQVHGTKDATILYDGSEELFEDWDPEADEALPFGHKTAVESYQHYLDKYGCDSEKEFTTTIEAHDGTKPSFLDKLETKVQYRDCGGDGQLKVGLWTIVDGGHIPLFLGSLKKEGVVAAEESFIYQAMMFIQDSASIADFED